VRRSIWQCGPGIVGLGVFVGHSGGGTVSILEMGGRPFLSILVGCHILVYQWSVDRIG
jgi:hypothetical protein